jgi:protein-disulfide isomerase
MRILTLISVLVFGLIVLVSCSPSDQQVEEAVKKVLDKEKEEKAKIFKYMDEYFALKRGQPPGQPGQPQGPGQMFATFEEELKNPKKVEIGSSPVKGSRNAPVTIVEFSDFQCPYCSRVGPTLDTLLKKYEGKIKLVFKHQPLPNHPNAKPAAVASMAAHKQGKFWEMHDMLFANQQQLDKESLVGFAKKLGLNEARFKKDMEDPQILKQVEEEGMWASQNGLGGTPVFLINGATFRGAQPLENFVQAVDKALQAAK